MLKHQRTENITGAIGWLLWHVCRSHYYRRRAGWITLNLVAKLMEFLYILKLGVVGGKTIYLHSECAQQIVPLFADI